MTACCPLPVEVGRLPGHENVSGPGYTCQREELKNACLKEDILKLHVITVFT